MPKEKDLTADVLAVELEALKADYINAKKEAIEASEEWDTLTEPLNDSIERGERAKIKTLSDRRHELKMNALYGDLKAAKLASKVHQAQVMLWEQNRSAAYQRAASITQQIEALKVQRNDFAHVVTAANSQAMKAAHESREIAARIEKAENLIKKVLTNNEA